MPAVRQTLFLRYLQLCYYDCLYSLGLSAITLFKETSNTNYILYSIGDSVGLGTGWLALAVWSFLVQRWRLFF
jgi:hypothetical protein